MRSYFILTAVICAVLGIERGWAATNNAPDRDLMARIHFAGTAQLASDANAGKFNDIAAMPESRDLREQTLQKLATAPFRYLKGKLANQNDDEASLIRPLAEDLIASESYIEMSGPTNPAPDFMLAVRLNNERAAVWRKNLATILATWTKLPVKDIQAEGFKGWELKKHEWPNLVRFFRAGDWVVFGWGQNELPLQAGLLRRIKDKGRPADALNGALLDAWVDWATLASRFHVSSPIKLPQTQLIAECRKDSGRPEGYVREQMVMKFPEPLGLTLDAWKIPTETIHSSTNDFLASFTAIRGIAPWLGRIRSVKELDATPLPNQAFVWAMSQIPFETSFAFPVPDATNYLRNIEPKLVSLVNSNSGAMSIGAEAEWTTNDEITVRGNPFFGPHLGAVRESAGDFLVGGVFPKLPREGPMPSELVDQIMSRTNLVCYDWEITEVRLAQWRALSQLSLIMAEKPITTTNTPAQKWIDAVKPKLGNCGTVITLTAPNELTLVRNSPIGLTGFEITWLAYLLDAPGFPLDTTYYDETHPPPDGIGKNPSP